MIRFTLLTTVPFRPSITEIPAVLLCLVHHRLGVAGEGGHSSSPRSETLSSAERTYLLGTTMLRMLCEGMQDRPRRRLGSRGVRPSAGRQPLVLLGLSPPTRCLAGMLATSSTRQSRARAVHRGGGGFIVLSFFLFVGVTRASVFHVAVRAVIIRDTSITPHCANKKILGIPV